MLTVNALVAADSVLIPMQCEYYALEGLSDLVETLRKVRHNLNSRLEIEGLLRTMYNGQSTLTQQVSNELESHFGNKVYQTIIPRNVRLAEAPSYGKPVIAFDRNSKGAQAYSALAREILERTPQHDQDERTRPRPRCPAGRQRRQNAATNSAACRSNRLKPGKYQPRTHMDSRVAGRTGRLDQGPGRDAAHPCPRHRQHAGRRALRDRRRRTPLARRAAWPA